MVSETAVDPVRDPMKCDEGYVCEVCGRDVERIVDSDLYLRFVLGEIPLERLHLQRERHIRCNPAMAQYIVATEFVAMECPGAFAKSELPEEYVVEEERRVTAGYRRLLEIPLLGIPITEYPLPKPEN